jgi:hypothetical protein
MALEVYHSQPCNGSAPSLVQQRIRRGSLTLIPTLLFTTNSKVWQQVGRAEQGQYYQAEDFCLSVPITLFVSRRRQWMGCRSFAVAQHNTWTGLFTSLIPFLPGDRFSFLSSFPQPCSRPACSENQALLTRDARPRQMGRLRRTGPGREPTRVALSINQ